LLFYALTTVLLARAIHGLSRHEPSALGASCFAAAFVVTYPTYVGMVSSRFQIYEQTIATGVLWAVLLIAGLFVLLQECTPRWLVAVCAAAGFIGMIRIPLAFYGPPTAGLALLIAHRRGLSRRALAAGAAAYVASASMYFVGNVLRFGGVMNSGYENCLCSAQANRLTRWGLPFALTPFKVAAKEMYATLFELDPVPTQVVGWAPPSVAKYAVGERWREYYAPTFDKWALYAMYLALAILCWRFVRGRLWRRDADLAAEVPAVLAAWAIPPALILFVFYAKISNWCTRYATDLYPCFAASGLACGMFLVDLARKRASSLTGSAQLTVMAAAALYTTGWQGWAKHLSHPIDVNNMLGQLKPWEERNAKPMTIPAHYKCGEPRPSFQVFTNLDEWRGDCSYSAGMAFTLKYSPCVTLTFGPGASTWNDADEDALHRLRVNGDFDRYRVCGAPTVSGAGRQVTMCQTRTPPFLLDGTRLYTIGSLDDALQPIDRLKLLQIEASQYCP
jgi:hypothetical protein